MRMSNTRWRVVVALSAGLVCGVPTLRADDAAAPVEFRQSISGPALPIAAAPRPAALATIEDAEEEESSEEVDLLPSNQREAEAIASRKPELIQERYPNGLIKMEREVLQDAEGNFILHGLYRYYDPSGQNILEGRFERNMKQGIWHRRHSGKDSALFATEPYKSFQPPFSSQANFRDNQMHGKWLIVDAHQRKVSEIEFANGQRHGRAAWYYASGSMMKELHFENGLIHGDALQWGADGKLTARENYHQGRKLAARIDYYPDGRKKQEVTYLHAAVEAATPDNWDTATLAVFENRGQDERHGLLRTWHPNGQLARQAEFQRDLPVKMATWWFANGQKQMEGMYIEGRPHDAWIWWHANGQKAVSGYYNEGTPTGIWSWWQDNGKLAQKADLSEEEADARLSRRRSHNPMNSMPNMVSPEEILR